MTACGIGRGLGQALVVVLALWAGTARADQAAIRATLDQMEKAVLAGDAAGYLKHVDTRDAIFLREQRMWAEDLKRHVPVEFTLAIVEPEPGAEADASGTGKSDGKDDASGKPGDDAAAKQAAEEKEPPYKPEFGASRATFRLRMSWKMGEDVGGAGVKLREIKCPVAFEQKDGRWLYRGEVWDAEERAADEKTGFEGVRVLYEPGLKETAKAVADVMPLVRQRVDALFGLKIKRVQEVKLYTSMLHLQASIYLSYKDGLGGWNEPYESVKILQRGRPRAEGLKTLLGHEYGHVATFELFPDSDKAPWWLLEGVAEFSAGHVRAAEIDGAPSGGSGKGSERAVLRWYRDKKLADWNDIADFRKTPGNLTGNVYTQGEHFVRFFTTRFGDAARNRWIKLMGEGKSLDDASMTVTGKTFGELDREWREAVGNLAEEKKDKESEDEKGT